MYNVYNIAQSDEYCLDLNLSMVQNFNCMLRLFTKQGHYWQLWIRMIFFFHYSNSLQKILSMTYTLDKMGIIIVFDWI